MGQEGFQGPHSPRRFLNILEQKYTPFIHLRIPWARPPLRAMLSLVIHIRHSSLGTYPYLTREI